MNTRACALAVLLAFSPSVLVSAPALAQVDALTDMARQRFQEGVKFFDGKKYEDARAAFLQAYALKHHPAVLLNLAQSELRSNHPVEAARHFSTYLRENTTATNLEKADAEKGLAEARVKTGRVQIAVNVAGADVLLDGELVGKAPIAEPVDVGPGNHVVEAKNGGHSATVTVTAAAGKVTPANLTLEGGGALPVVAPIPPVAAPAAPATTPPPAAPASPAEPPVTPPADTTTPPADTPPPEAEPGVQLSTSGREPFFPWAKHNKIAWAGAGLTVVGLGMFIGFSLAAGSAGDNADKLSDQIKARWQADPKATFDRPSGNVCAPPTLITTSSNFTGPCNSLRDSLDQQNSDKTLATVGIVVAGVGVAGTVVAYMLTSKKKGEEAPPPATMLAPSIGPQTATLNLVGSF